MLEREYFENIVGSVLENVSFGLIIRWIRCGWVSGTVVGHCWKDTHLSKAMFIVQEAIENAIKSDFYDTLYCKKPLPHMQFIPGFSLTLISNHESVLI